MSLDELEKLDKNIHNAFNVVFDTYKNVEKLMQYCTNKAGEKYYMPANRFLRHSSDLDWTGWIYWSFILLFQRYKDGEVGINKWINASIYAVEINLDSETCDEPLLIIAKLEYSNMEEWSEGCSPSNHYIFYNPIHGHEKYFQSKKIVNTDDFIEVLPKEGKEEIISQKYWSLKRVVRKSYKLTTITKDNAYEKIFGTFEELVDK